jgi:hypothetical protein
MLIVPGPASVQRAFDDARAPFLYTGGQRGRGAARTRSRGRRTDPTARPGARPSRVRRSR